MKFSELPYIRPDLDQLRAQCDALCARFENAASAEEQIAAYQDFEELSKDVMTNLTIASIRHTVDTRDEFYNAENDFSDEAGPQIEEMFQKFNQALLASKFRPELEKHYGTLIFKKAEISARAFSPEILDLMQEENQLASQYQKLYASGMVEFRGEKLPLPKLGPYMESPDRTTRREAYAARASFFEANRAELDELYGKLIRCRNEQGRRLGHKNYIQLGYDRLGRNCYTPEDVAAFREQIARDMVPIVAERKQAQKERIGVDRICLYDDKFLFPDGNAKPEGTAEEILAAGKRMYHELSPETAEFIDAMFDMELFDVLSKPGKAPGGYCTDLPKYKMPFIFSNFNGTSGDVDVLTHEAGHAFNAYRVMRKDYPMALMNATMETCECHSMSMEFLTQDYHKYFFGAQTAKYEQGHCDDALMFIPYGCMVDEFQHLMYENENMTPDERFEFWRGELSRCIRCNACRNVCPACSCEKCVFDKDNSGIAQKAAADSFEEKMFHIIRAFHVAGRCTDCGECSRVCPQNIPLHLLNRKFIKDINTFYGDFQAGEDTESRAPLTNYTKGDVEPSIVYHKGGKN